MRKMLKKVFCAFVAASVCASSIQLSAYADDAAYLEREENFESFAVGDDWKSALPSGWKIQTFGDCATTEVSIAQDPVNADNKVLKLKGVEKNYATGKNYEKIIFQSNSGRVYAPKDGRNIVVSADMYIDAATAHGLPMGSNPGRDSAVIAGLATNSVGGTFTVSYLRRQSDSDEQTLVYSRVGKSGTDYFGSANTAVDTGRWVNVTQIVSQNDDGSFSYRQYIDGNCVSIKQSGGDFTSDLHSVAYDGTPDSSKITNAYGAVFSVISDALTTDDGEPTLYFDNIRLYEVDKNISLTVTNLTSADVLSAFDTESDSFSLGFSHGMTEKQLNNKIYVMTDSGDKKYVSHYVLADDGMSASVYLDGTDGLQANTAYTLCIDKGLTSGDYFCMANDFTTGFKTKQKSNPTPEPEPGDVSADVTELINNDMESYEIGSDWLGAVPTGWTVSRSGGNLGDAAVTVVQDPVDADNKCLMLTPGKTNAVGGETVRIMANTQANVSAADCKKLITRVKIYIDPNSVDGFVKSGDKGLDGTALSGLAINASGNSVFNVTTIRKDNETKIPYMYARTGATSSDWYADKMIEIPTGRWVEITHVADISDSGENAEFPVYTYKQYIDGNPTVLTYNKMDGKPQTTDLHRNSYKGVPSASDCFNTFYGIVNAVAVTPNASVAPTIYFDDYYAAVIGDYSFGIKNDTASVEPYGDIEVEFPSAFDDTNADYIKKSLSVHKVNYDESGSVTGYDDIDGKITVTTDDNRIFRIKADDGLKYNSYYCVRLDPSKAVSAPYSVVDSFYQKIDGGETVFKTKAAESVYIDTTNGVLKLNGAQSISDAESIGYTMKLANLGADKQCVAACVIYGENETMIKTEYRTVSVSSDRTVSVPFSFEGLQSRARKIGLYIFEKDSNGLISGLMQVPAVIE